MVYKVELTEEAADQVSALPKRIAGQVIRKIEMLSCEPRPAQAKQLVDHEHLYRVRTGDYRILYQIEAKKLVILVVKVGHRRDVYKRIPPPSST